LLGQSETGFEQVSVPSTKLSAPKIEAMWKKMMSATGFDHLTYYFGNQNMASTGLQAHHKSHHLLLCHADMNESL
jgi:hypothetical protein